MIDFLHKHIRISQNKFASKLIKNGFLTEPVTTVTIDYKAHVLFEFYPVADLAFVAWGKKNSRGRRAAKFTNLLN